MVIKSKVDLDKKFVRNKIESYEYSTKAISALLIENFTNLTKPFYEMQTTFLSTIYKRYQDIDTANIALCFIRNVHLEILRKKDADLDYDISLERLLYNINNIYRPTSKIVSIVRATEIPKETVRRKIKNLFDPYF